MSAPVSNAVSVSAPRAHKTLTAIPVSTLTASSERTRAHAHYVLHARLLERERDQAARERKRVILFFLLLRVWPLLCFTGAGLVLMRFLFARYSA